MKKHTALKQNIKNDTSIEFRRDIKALPLLAVTTATVTTNPTPNLIFTTTAQTTHHSHAEINIQRMASEV